MSRVMPPIALSHGAKAGPTEPERRAVLSSKLDLGPDDPEYGYTRGRLVAVRDAELVVRRLTEQSESVLVGLETSHHVLHEAFPAEE